MEKIERKQSADSDQKERGFFVINSLGELLPIVLVIFFFAYLAGSHPALDSTAHTHQLTTDNLGTFKIVEQQELPENNEQIEEKTYLNTSPKEAQAKILPIIKKENKRRPVQKNLPKETEEDLARPQFPKASPREALPPLQVSEPIKKAEPAPEKYSQIELEPKKEILLEEQPTETAMLSQNTAREKLEPIALLNQKNISKLAEIDIEIVEMSVEADWVPRQILEEEKTEEELVENLVSETKKEEVVETVNISNYNSSDFKWALNNHNQGVKKSASFTNTPDRKASYCHTEAGIVLKINDLRDIDPTYGIFVEKSDDDKEYHSIGVINAENRNELFYFDSEYSFDGNHHYRFRSTNKAGEEVEFGKVSVIHKASISPILSQVNAAGKYNLILDSKSINLISYEIKEAWGSLNIDKGKKSLVEGENSLSFDLTGDPGLYFLTISTENQVLDLLIEKPGISPDLSFYDHDVSGQQSFGGQNSVPYLIEKPKTLNFDFYLKNGNTLIFNEGEYNSETVKIKKAKIGTLPESLQGRHSDEMLWFTASSNISYLHQKVPVILEHNNQEIAAQINIFASKNTIRPISHFSPSESGEAGKWRIPGIESCPNIDLMVFNDWGNLIFKKERVTESNLWNGKKNGEELPSGMYYYLLGEYGGWVQLER